MTRFLKTCRWTRGLQALLLGAAAIAQTATGADGAAPADAGRPVLLELFTSQGCSSCPPADAVLRELATRPDVLALGFHVDYWDHLGWADAFASPQFTARQQRYAEARGFRVYTPQLVVDGEVALVGSRRAQAETAIADARRTAVPARLVRRGDRLKVRVGTLAATADATGEVWLCSYDREREAFIRRGENAGRRIVYPNVVRSMRKLADWSNAELTLDVRLADDERGERLALIVQRRDGRVWAVAMAP